MNMLQPENPISPTVSRARKPHPLRVPALKSSTKDGKPYERAAHNQSQITEMPLHPPSVDVPITTKERGKPSLVKLFRKSPRKIKYGLETGMAQMRAALGVKKPRRGRKPSK